jgi:hypothetical protein
VRPSLPAGWAFARRPPWVDFSSDDATVTVTQLAGDKDRVAGTQLLAIPLGNVVGDFDLTHQPFSCLPRVRVGNDDQQLSDRIAVGVLARHRFGNKDFH